ncbi:MAG: single-stranded DNA-binding protein [Deferribacteres bacterium]|nr:single-stranded DNA-binding protein [candidate division KSB1 bacterium]MCB9511533.1 single-stranded DNA-binding protein [Deferribacteres bacterium]
MAKGTVNKVILIGRLGADPELKYTPSGAAVTNFNIATNEVWKDKDGNFQERTEWHRLVLWQKLAERANEYLKKGHRVYVEGQLRTRDWTDKDGTKRYTTEVFVQQMQFLESREGSGGTGSSMPPPPSEDDMSGPDFSSSDDDLPF